MKKTTSILLTLLLTIAILPLAGVATAHAAMMAIPEEMDIYGLQLTCNKGEAPEDADDPKMGDAVLVESGGEFLLMDTGNSYVSDSVIHYLKALGVQRMSIYVSHLHPDHFYGMGPIADSGIQVDTLYLPDPSVGADYSSQNGASNLSQLRKAENWFPDAQVVYLKKGSNFSFGTVSAQVLGPVSNVKQSSFKTDKWGDQSGHYLNNQSLTTMLTCGGVRYLTTGDIESKEEQKSYQKLTLEEEALVKEYGNDLRADILKMPHHGLKFSSSTAFARTVQPKYSFAENAGYEEPTISENGNTVARSYTSAGKLQKYGLTYLVNTEKATLHIQIRDGEISLRKAPLKNGKITEGEVFAGSSYKGWIDLAGHAQVKNGSYTGKNHYYMVNGVFKTGVVKIGKKWYNFGDGVSLQQGVYENGKYVGWRFLDDAKKHRGYFYAPNQMGRAAAAIGIAKAKARNGKTWYFYFNNKTGFRYEPTKSSKGGRGWYLKKIGKYKYLIKVKEGVVYNCGAKRATNRAFGGKIRAFDTKGRMITGWAKVGGSRHYYDKKTGYRVK